MKYKIKKIENAKLWNDFVKQEKLVNILGSWEWIIFEKELGFDTCAYGFFEKDDLKGVFAFRTINAKRGKYLILRQNTFFDWEDKELVSGFIDFVRLKALEKNCSFFRICPPIIFSEEKERIFLENGFKKSVVGPIDAQFTTILYLENDLNDILFNMRKNTRYLIRKGEKEGIEVLNTKGHEYLDTFEQIYEETVQRHKWDAVDFEYIKKQYLFFSSKGISRMFVVKYRGDVLGIAIFTQFGKQVIYHHSASILTDVPIMYVLIFEAIKFYKELGLQEFNFFGLSYKENKNHSWHGLSLFKRGFGGQERRLLNTYDYPAKSTYYITKFFECLLKC